MKQLNRLLEVYVRNFDENGRSAEARFVLKVSGGGGGSSAAGDAPLAFELRARTHDEARAWVTVLERRRDLVQSPYTTALFETLGVTASGAAVVKAERKAVGAAQP